MFPLSAAYGHGADYPSPALSAIDAAIVVMTQPERLAHS
jgi:hypothetical protein